MLGLAAGMLLLGAALMAWNLFGTGGGAGRAFFTVDDGQTTFVDRADRLAPFEHQGRQAVEARRFTADGGKTSFVGYLVRYTDDGKRRLQDLRRAGGRPTMDGAILREVEVKRPGEPKWVRQADPAGMAIVTVTAPDDRTRPAEPVDP